MYTRIPVPRVWETDQTFFFLDNKECWSLSPPPPPPHPGPAQRPFSGMPRHHGLHPIVKHLP